MFVDNVFCFYICSRQKTKAVKGEVAQLVRASDS